MARVFGLRSYRVDVPLANTPIPLLSAALTAAGHNRFVEAFRVYSLSTNSGVFALGGSNVTVNTTLFTDGEPINPSDFTEWGVNPKTAAMPSEFDLTAIYISTSSAGDDFFVTYISKED